MIPIYTLAYRNASYRESLEGARVAVEAAHRRQTTGSACGECKPEQACFWHEGIKVEGLGKPKKEGN